jgi:hypothetical protein
MRSWRAFFSYFHVLLILFYVCVARINGYRRIHRNRDIDRYYRRLIESVSEEDEQQQQRIYADIFDSSTYEIEEEGDEIVAAMSSHNRSLSSPVSIGSIDHRIKSLPGLSSSIAASISQYAGYINIDAEKDSNVFYWLFEAPNNADALPLLIWLNGGPGKVTTTSSFGIPYFLTMSD